MNILLVMPKTGYMWDEWATPPAGICYVSSYLKSKGKSVLCVNLNLETDDVESVIKRYIDKYNIDIVGTGELVVNYDKIQEIVSAAKKAKPNVKVFIGGGLVTNSPFEAMQLVPEADYGVIGEGEESSDELIDFIDGNSKYSKIKEIPGLIIQSNRGGALPFYTSQRGEIKKIDTLPFPDWEGFRLTEMCKKYAADNVSIAASIISSRSCPFACTFCSKSSGRRIYRKRSLDNVFSEIDYLVHNFGIKKLSFQDELFADNIERLFEFCDRIQKYNIKYRVSMHVGKNFTYKLLKRMYDSGCSVIFYGLESADNSVLRSMHKNITIDDIERCLKITKQAGIIAEGNFIFGDSVETIKTVKNTINWIRKNFNKGFFEVAPIKLYPGSQLYEDAVTDGKIKDTTQFIKDKCPLINISSLNDKQYQDMINYDLTVIQEVRNTVQTGIEMHFGHDKSINIDYICENCNMQNKIKLDSESHMLRLYTTHCSKCGSLEYLNLFPLYYGMISGKLREIMSTHKVGIFGCGNIWKMFYSAGKEFKEGKYIIFDETPYLQKEGWNGRNVYSPKKISEFDVDIIIGMLRVSSEELDEKIRVDYENNNTNIIMCYQLMSSNTEL